MTAALGVAAIIMMFIAGGFDLLTKSQESLAEGNDALTIADQIKTSLADPKNCMTLLNGQSYGAMTSLKLGGTVVNAGDTLPATHLQFTKADLSYTNTTTGALPGVPMQFKDPFTLADYGGLKFSSVLTVSFNRPGSVQLKPVSFPVDIYKDGGGTIRSCGSMTNVDQSTCGMMGYAWNSQTSQCMYFTNQCLYGGTYAPDYGSPPSGGFVNPVTGSPSCPQHYQARPAASIGQAQSCGKACVTNVSTQTYECVRCLDASGNEVTDPTAVLVGSSSSDQFDAGEDLQDTENQLGTDDSTILGLTTLSAMAPGATCDPAGTVLMSNSCSGPSSNVSMPICCSGSAHVCYNVDPGGAGFGPYNIARSVICQ